MMWVGGILNPKSIHSGGRNMSLLTDFVSANEIVAQIARLKRERKKARATVSCLTDEATNKLIGSRPLTNKEQTELKAIKQRHLRWYREEIKRRLDYLRSLLREKQAHV